MTWGGQGLGKTAAGHIMGSGEGDDSWQLLATCAQDNAALTTLYQRHKDYVFRLAWGFLGSRSLAEDALQEVFLRLREGAARPRWIRAQFRTWLYKVVLNVTRELRRRHRSPREVALEEGGAPGAEDSSPQPWVPVDPQSVPGSDPQLLFLDLMAQLQRLPQRQREVLVLRHLEGLSTAEVATVLGCRQGTVKVHLHRALMALQGQLGEESDGQRQ
ncbi:MAG: RNA polymerase sigma factor [Candidatus Competibacterales bacterium]